MTNRDMKIHEKFLDVKYYMSNKMGWNTYMVCESEGSETFAIILNDGKFYTFSDAEMCYINNDELNNEFEKFIGPIQLGLL